MRTNIFFTYIKERVYKHNPTKKLIIKNKRDEKKIYRNVKRYHTYHTYIKTSA